MLCGRRSECEVLDRLLAEVRAGRSSVLPGWSVDLPLMESIVLHLIQ